jgi:putative spermidine/putrescine transport system permease protein
VVGDPAFARAVAFTVQVAVVSTVVSGVLAVVLAAALHRQARWTRMLTAVPVAVPHLVVAAIAVAWVGPGGLVERVTGDLPVVLIGDPNGLGVIAVYVYKEAPFLTLLVLAALGRDTDALDEAAAAHGAGIAGRLRHVVVPAALPALAGGSLVVAAFTLAATEIPYVVGPTRPATIATYALDATRLNGPLAVAHQAAALLVAAVLALVLGVTGALLWRLTHRSPDT